MPVSRATRRAFITGITFAISLLGRADEVIE